MRYLVISDIHGNREALDAVVADAHGQYDRAISCGDLSDYGADSNYVIGWARANLSAVIRGNHDRICSGLDTWENFSDLAQISAQWTQEHLTPENRTYLRELREGPAVIDDCLLLAHGSPRNEDEYVTTMPEVADVFAYLAKTKNDAWPLFFGHTHLQGVFVRSPWRLRRVSSPLTPTPEVRIQLDAGTGYMINPGSVGQPRDKDPRAAYALFDTDAREVALRRVRYDYETTERKILAAGLPPRLGARLALGR